MTRERTVDRLSVRIFDDVRMLARAAAGDAADVLRLAIGERGAANVMLATGNSQLIFLAELVTYTDVDWGRVTAFHMDEYVGLPPTHAASFQRYMRERVAANVPFEEFHYLQGDTGDAEHLREELGDLLLQVYFHAVIAEESGEFTIDDIAADIIAKMIRRNPHVFGTAEGGTPEEINEVWESIKRAEKQRTSVTEGLPPGLPALLYADKVLDRLERILTAAYKCAWGRPADSDEVRLGLAFVARQAQRYRTRGTADEPARMQALVDFCHAVLNTNEFVMVD